MKRSVKYLILIPFFSAMVGCTSAGESWLGFAPKVYKSDEVVVEVTRGSLHTTSDTGVIATEHCAKYKKLAKLVEKVNPWEIPNRDKYACVAP